MGSEYAGQLLCQSLPNRLEGHPDAPALTVLGAYLRNGFLHRAIREQGGAYGGGASHDANVGAFRFFSYRDPRNIDTLADFDASVEWLLESKADEHALEEAILSVISSLDKPASPAGEVKKAFYDALYQRTLEQKRQLREPLSVPATMICAESRALTSNQNWPVQSY